MRGATMTVSALIDVVIIVSSMAIAYWVRFSVLQGTGPMGTAFNHIVWCTAFSPVYLFFYCIFGIYDRHTPSEPTHVMGRLIAANTIAMMLYIDIIFFFRMVDFSRWMIIIAWIITNIASCLKLAVNNQCISKMLGRGDGRERIVIIGSGTTAQTYIDALNRERPACHDVVGIVSNTPTSGANCLGTYANALSILEYYVPDRVVVALDSADYDIISDVLLACENTGIKVCLLPTYHDFLPDRPHIIEQAGLPLIDMNRTELDNMGYAFIKRAFDVACSLVLIILTSPILLAAAIGTKASSPGPVLFKQERIGRGRKPFYILKFRSMRLNDTSDSAWTRDGDPRRTKFGAFMRRYSIDELPQLFNVLKGDMSLVGPRPEIPSYVEHFKCSVPLYMVRHQVRPGMTGWAQVNGLRGDTSIQKRVEYDLYYIENWSFLFDLRILAMTPFRGIVNKQESLIK